MFCLGLFNFASSYNKPGPGVSKDEVPKAAPIRFFEIYLRKFGKLAQLNLIFLIPTIVVLALMIALYFAPTHIMLSLPSGEQVLQLDVWNLFVVPIPLIFLSPFVAGLTIVTRNFTREEHAFVWSDFWESVKNNGKLFFINGIIVYVVYFILCFSLIYYYNSAVSAPVFYVPFWFCILLSVLFLFMQYYIPIMFVTFDLKIRQVYRNALVFILAGFGRNLLITLILGGLLILIVGVIPIMPLTVMIFFVLLIFFVFSFVSYLINFTVYPVIDKYLIQPYYQSLEKAKEENQEKDPVEEKFPELFANTSETEEEEDKEKYVYVNGRLVKQSDMDKYEKKPENDEDDE